MKEATIIYQSNIKNNQNQQDFDYTLQAVLFEICYQDRDKILDIAQFIKAINPSVSLLALINEISDTSFTWSMLVFLDDQAFVFIIDLIHKLLDVLVKEKGNKELMKKIVEELDTKADIETILNHY